MGLPGSLTGQQDHKEWMHAIQVTLTASRHNKPYTATCYDLQAAHYILGAAHYCLGRTYYYSKAAHHYLGAAHCCSGGDHAVLSLLNAALASMVYNCVSCHIATM